jgi:phosphatidylglycerol lysyltransferase
MFKRISIFLYALVMIAVVVFDPFTVQPAPFSSDGKYLKIELKRGTFTVFDFPSRKSATSALMLFGSGDGGWGNLEEAICQAFQNQGFEVIGIDSHAYAQTDYNLEILQSDYGEIARTALAPFANHPPPLIVGGYSMGAAQAIAVAGGPHLPEGLIGLLVIDPLSRGRYGLRDSDQMDILPTGPGTFSMNDFAKTMGSLRVVQWHAADDSIDSRSWLDSLTAQHKEFTFPNTGHDYDTDRDDFLHRLVESAGWILSPTPDDTLSAKTTATP